MPTTASLTDLPGLSYRRIDYWCRKGYLGEEARTQIGSGHVRTLSGEAADVVAWMGKLVLAGFEPEIASQIAWRKVRSDPNCVFVEALVPGIHLMLVDPPQS